MKFFFKIVSNSVSIFAVVILFEIIPQMILYSNVKEYAELKLGIPYGFLKFYLTEEGTYKHFISFNYLLFDYFCFGVLTGIYHIIQHKLKEKKVIKNT